MSQGNSFRNGLIIFFALIGAIWLGISVVTEQTETLIKISGSILLITCIFLGRKIWLLLIFFSALKVPLIRGFGTLELGQFLFIAFTFLITLMRRQTYNFRFGEKEVWMLLLIGCVVQVYLRNPVGLNILGSGAVGARPYFMVIMSFVTAIILGNIVVQPTEIKWLMRISIIGSLLGIGLTTLRMREISQLGGVSVLANDTMGDNKGSGRISILSEIAISIARIVASYVSPLKSLMRPLWALLIISSFAAAAGSGYRNCVASVGLMYLVGLAYRGGFTSVLIASVSAAMGLIVLAIWNIAMPLPGNIQRALSPFPGTWEERHVKAGTESTEWRVEMWKEALFTEFWIQNKIFGDGLGFTRRELLMMQDFEYRGGSFDNRGSGMTALQESMMVTGNYHSGPVQTVRTVGYVGLIILVLAMIRMAVHAHRQIIRCRGTEWYPLSLYIGIPAIVLPPFFVFVFGQFGEDVATVFFLYGLISLLEKNLPIPPYVKPQLNSYILPSNRLVIENKFK